MQDRLTKGKLSSKNPGQGNEQRNKKTRTQRGAGRCIGVGIWRGAETALFS